MLRRIVSFFAGLSGIIAYSTRGALAASTALPQLQGAETFIGNVISVFCYLGFIVLVGMAVWEFFGHRRVAQIIGEVVGAIVVVVVAINGQNIATTIGLTAALIK